MAEELNPYPEGSQQHQEWQWEWERKQEEREAAKPAGSDVPEEVWRGQNA